MAVSPELRHRPAQDLDGARAYMQNGTGKITVNERPLDEFFGRETGRMIVRQPLELVQLTGKFDITGAGQRAVASLARPAPSATALPGR